MSSKTPVPVLDLPSGNVPDRLPTLKVSFCPLGLISSSPNDIKSNDIPYLFSSDDRDDTNDSDSYDMNLLAYSVNKNPVTALNSLPKHENGASIDQAQWRKVFDADQQRYYLLNEATGETKWDDDLEMDLRATDEICDPPPVAGGDEIQPVIVAEDKGESWVKCVDNSTGKSYWFNSTTGESKWDESDVNDGVSGWCEYTDMNGNQYFYNEVEMQIRYIQITPRNHRFRSLESTHGTPRRMSKLPALRALRILHRRCNVILLPLPSLSLISRSEFRHCSEVGS